MRVTVLTVHHRTDRWIDVQLDALERHMSVDYRVHAVLDGVTSTRFDRVLSVGSTRHADRLDALADDACRTMGPDDQLWFLDGDAFPVADPAPIVTEALQSNVLVAVRRDEGNNGRWPHPSFCAIRVKDWQGIPGTWTVARVTDDPSIAHQADVGGELLLRLRNGGWPWMPLLRSNTVNPHPMFFAVYGGVIYHHGAGFRAPFTAADGRDTADSIESRRARLAENERLSGEWWRAARDDPEFWRRLCA